MVQLTGTYRDTIVDTKGCVIARRAWQSNTIVDSAWQLMTSLLKNEPGLGGILYWAVGTGEEAWDGLPDGSPPTDHTAASLANEIHRVPLAAEDITYRNVDNDVVDEPTRAIEITATFSWDTGQTLREFGLFGGDASEAAGSGYLFNYVTHAKVELEADTQLRRRIRLVFDGEPPSPPPPGEPEPEPFDPSEILEIPEHWLGERRVRLLVGIGSDAPTLKEMGLESINDMAHFKTPSQPDGLPVTLSKLLNLRARARLVLRTASAFLPIAEQLEINEVTSSIKKFLDLTPEQVAEAMQIELKIAQIVQAHLEPLRLVLKAQVLRDVTIEQLVAGP